MSVDALLNTTKYGGGGELDQKCKEEGAELYIQILGSIIFVVVWPFIVLDMKWFPLGRPAASMIGGALMVVFTVVGQYETYDIQGELGNMQTIFLLVGMMMLSFYYDREGLLRLVALAVFGGSGGAKPFKYILWKVCLLSAVLSALITNDAACVVLTPLILIEFQKQGRSKRELLPICLGIATSANIGSAATVFGNPQNAFIAAYAGVNLLQFFAALLPAAFLGCIVDIILLYIFFYKTVFEKYDKSEDEDVESVQDQHGNYTVPGTLAEERESIALSYDQSQDPYLGSRIAAERDQIKENRSSSYQRRRSPFPRSKNVPDIRVEGDEAPLVTDNGNKKDYGDGSVEGGGEEIVRVKSIKERNWRERVFMVWLMFATFLVVALLAIPPPPTVPIQFNLGLVPVGAAVFTMLVDTIFLRNYAYDVIMKIDWTLIVMFMGLFVWLGGFQNTCYPQLAFDKLSSFMNLYRFEGVLLFTVFVIIGSNIFSNVPLTILIVDQIKVLCGENICEGPLGGLLLAWISTIAGNFTLIGSVANLIVAEKARGTAGYRITFWNYFKFGGISTTIILFGMLPIVYFVGANIP